MLSSYGSDIDLEALEVFGAGLVGVMLAVYIFVMLIALGIAAVSYVLRAVSIYTIANRRGIKNPWLAWVPVVNCWTLGCISDQYRYVAKGQVKNKRKSLLILYIILMALEIGMMVCNITTMIQFEGTVREDMMVLAGTLGVITTVLSLAVAGVSIAYTVINYMALYDLYCSCEPGNGVLYLLLSIFVSWLTPVFLMIVRKKDGGMPPRKQPAAATIPEEPAPQPAEPVEEPWQQETTEQEPWQNPEE